MTEVKGDSPWFRAFCIYGRKGQQQQQQRLSEAGNRFFLFTTCQFPSFFPFQFFDDAKNALSCLAAAKPFNKQETICYLIDKSVERLANQPTVVAYQVQSKTEDTGQPGKEAGRLFKVVATCYRKKESSKNTGTFVAGMLIFGCQIAAVTEFWIERVAGRCGLREKDKPKVPTRSVLNGNSILSYAQSKKNFSYRFTFYTPMNDSFARKRDLENVVGLQASKIITL